MPGEAGVGTVVGNYFTTGSIIAMSANCGGVVIVGNYFENGRIAQAGATAEANTIFANLAGTNATNNISILDEMKCVTMKNTSGGSLAAGDVVVLKAVAAGNEITTTTAGGDDMVFGMATGAIADTAFGRILTLGKTVSLKVDGTTDIAIGDLLGTSTTAKIAMKAGVGDMAFAIALEVYATDDSAGVINALLVTPRKV